MIGERGKRAATFFLTLFITVFLFSCSKETKIRFTEEEKSCFSVHYIDVGEGDSIFVKFPDGKNMLIDCGEKGEENFEKISEILDAFSCKTIDYFVLTHTDSDHTGGAENIIEKYEVNTAFLPDVKNAEAYENFHAAKSLLGENEIKISQTGRTVEEEDYFFTFLYPEPIGFKESAYADFNSAEVPNEGQRNNISAVIYLEYSGVRFLFTGDAGLKAEERVAEYYRINYYDRFLSKGRKVLLEDLDFLKVTHHGAEDGSGSEFLSLLRPKNAVISSGNSGYFDHPSSEVLERLSKANPDYNLYRTDTFGTVSVFVNGNGEATVKTEAN